MRYFWIVACLAIASLAWMNLNGYRIFTNNVNTWNQAGAGYHK